MDAASPPSPPRIDARGQGEGRTAVLQGRWTAAELAESGRLRQVGQALGALPPTVGWDLQPIERLDHLGAQLLWNHWGRQWPAQLALSPEQRSMLERVAEFTHAQEPPARGGFAQTVDRFGARVLHSLGELRSGVRLV